MNKLRLFVSLMVFSCFLFLANTAAAVVPHDTPYKEAVTRGVDYLSEMQNEDGGFSSDTGRPSSWAATAWAVMALRAAGEDVNSGKWVKTGHGPIDFLNSGTCPEASTDHARLLLALSAADQGPAFQGTDLAKKILSFQQPNGQFAQMDKGEEGLINAHMWSIIGLASANIDIPNKEKAADWLRQQQNEDGGFSWASGEAGDPDDTGVAMTALVLLGEQLERSSVLQKAVSYLHAQQQQDGGFKWTGQESNAATDAWVIQGLVAAGADPGDTEWKMAGGDPFTHLISFQNNDGSFNWTTELRSSPVLMTSYAIMALSKKPLPVNIEYFRDEDTGSRPSSWTKQEQADPVGSQAMNIVLFVGSREALVNGQTKPLDSPPMIIDNSTFVPLRFVGDCLGAECRWVAGSSEVEITYNGETFTLAAGKGDGTIAAVIREGRTLVPLRYISEKMGAEVYWIGRERRIEIEK